jgi:hypothetical protein
MSMLVHQYAKLAAVAGMALSMFGVASAATDPAADTGALDGPDVRKLPSYDTTLNVCRGVDPRCYHDWASEERVGNRVLIYTRTAGPRHANLGPRLAAGLNPPLAAANVVQNALKTWLEQESIEVDWTEDVTRITNLHRYKTVIFASTSRDPGRHGEDRHSR